MTTFIKSLLIGFVLLGAVAAGVSRMLPLYHLSHGIAGLFLMALNATAAVLLLHFLGKRNFIQVSLISMVARLLSLALIMVAALRIFRPTQPEAFSFVFSAMAGYIVFQALEIRYFVRQGALR